MAEINTAVYGAEADWNDASLTQYVEATPVKDRIQCAEFGTNESSIGAAIVNDKLVVGTDWDTSLSYAGLGYEAPLSNITWWVKQGTASEVPEEQNIYYPYATENSTMTNFALGQCTTNIFGGHGDTTQGYIYENMWGNQKFGFDRWNCGGRYDNYYSNYRGFAPFVRIPIKRIVLCPLILARKTDGTDPQTYTLAQYESAKSTHPYVMYVGMTAYFDRDSSKYTPGEEPAEDFARTGLADFNSLCLLHHFTGLNGIVDTTMFPEHEIEDLYLPMISGSAEIGDRAVPIAGDLFGAYYSNTANTTSYARPYASGFGLEWTTFSKDENNTSDVEGKLPGHVVCDVSSMSYEDFVEAVRHTIACFGLFFIDNPADKNLALDDEKVMLGILVDGIGHGDYTNGDANREQDQWLMDDAHDIDYDPNQPAPEPPGPEPDPNPIGPETPGFTLAVDNGSVCYVITKTEWNQIWNDIYGGSKSNWKDLIDGLALYGANPLNCILNYRWYPFIITASDTAPLRLGSSVVQPSSHVYHKISNLSESFKSTVATFWAGRAKNFVESKKTKCRVFLPFYGYYELPMSLVMKKELSIQFQYDLPNDTGIWFIMFGGTIYDWVECSPYIEIPITGDNSLQIAAAKAQRNLQIAMAIGGAVIGVATGVGVASGAISAIGAAAAETASITGGSLIGAAASNIAPLATEGLLAGLGTGGAIASGAIGAGAAKTASSVYNTALQVGTLATNVPVHSAASDTTFLSLPMYPYIQFYQNDMQLTYDAAGYKKSTGIACNCWKKISEMDQNSLLAVSTPVLDDYSNMEASEIEALHAALVAGFYP